VYATGCICLPVLPIIYLDSGRQNIPTQYFSRIVGEIGTLTFSFCLERVMFMPIKSLKIKGKETGDCVRDSGGV
jgi:hypothetical protein